MKTSAAVQSGALWAEGYEIFVRLSIPAKAIRHAMLTLSILSAQPSAPPLPTSSLPIPKPNPYPNLSISLLPSVTCALQCQHFQSYALFLLSLSTLVQIALQLVFFRCSGCTQELNLHRPIILSEVTEFFNGLGVSDFTFDSCRLVILIFPN